MSDSVLMPALGESVTEGTVTRWLKAVGEPVAVDEPLLEVSTDKVDTEIPSPFAGVLTEILVQEDETAAVGAALAIIGGEVGAAPAESAAAPVAAAPVAAAPAPSASGQDVTMPALGESVTEGTVTRWLKAVGESVELDEPLLEVSTDKVDTEIPSPFAGTLLAIQVQEDETAAVGAVLASIGSAGAAAAPVAAAEVVTAPAIAPEPAPVAVPVAVPAPVAASTPVNTGSAQAPQGSSAAPIIPATTPVALPTSAPAAAAPATSAPVTAVPRVGAVAEVAGYVTPLVRKLAADNGVDLSSLKGTGVGGRIRKQDVLEAAAAPTASAAIAGVPAKGPRVIEVSPLRGTTEKLSRLRKVIARRMVEALQLQAQLTTVIEVDLTRVAALRAANKASFKAKEGVNLTFLPFLTLAAVEALKSHPKVNASIDGENVVYHASENIGIAVDADGGLVVPVIKNAGEENLAGLSRKIVDLAGRARNNKLVPDEMAGGTFTITNTGSGGALFDTPIVPNPTVAIMGTGTIVKRPVVLPDADGNDTIAIRSMMYLSLSYDHRLVDGADAARFLMAVKARIEEGDFAGDIGL